MNSNFSFNSTSHDFWEIYEAIKQFYPIGLKQREGKGIYFDYPGLKKLEEIIVENIHVRENYIERWVEFTQKIGKELGKEIVGTTGGQAPSFSSSIILEKYEYETCIHTKELHFSVSLVGKFFHIYGIDNTVILENQETKCPPVVNFLTISPIGEYKESFDFLENKLRKKYPEHKIVPIFYGQMVIDGLRVRYSDDEECTANQALFNDSLKQIPRRMRGEKFYGAGDWVKNK